MGDGIVEADEARGESAVIAVFGGLASDGKAALPSDLMLLSLLWRITSHLGEVALGHGGRGVFGALFQRQGGV